MPRPHILWRCRAAVELQRRCRQPQAKPGGWGTPAHFFLMKKKLRTYSLELQCRCRQPRAKPGGRGTPAQIFFMKQKEICEVKVEHYVEQNV